MCETVRTFAMHILCISSSEVCFGTYSSRLHKPSQFSFYLPQALWGQARKFLKQIDEACEEVDTEKLVALLVKEMDFGNGTDLTVRD